MTISAKVIASSIMPGACAITTLQLRYPRFIHAEFMTHRVFSRNASSSRAIPLLKMIEDIERDPVTPSYWGKNQKGMQAREELEGFELAQAKETWQTARQQAIFSAKEFEKLGVHKQIANRVLEAFSHINVVVTSTDWDNFFALRMHPDAQPEMQELARAMGYAMAEAKTETTRWHLPYIDMTGVPKDNPHVISTLMKISAARCARVSYLTHEGKEPSMDEDLKLYDRLSKASPPHLSPLEHPAKCQPASMLKYNNFRQWKSLRYSFERAEEFGL